MGLAKAIGIILIVVAVIMFALWYFNIDAIGMAQNAVKGGVNWFSALSDTAKALYVSVVGAFGGIAGWIKTKVNFSSFRKTTTDAQAQASAKMDELQKISAQKDLTIQSATTRAETAEAKAAQYETEFQNYKTVLDGKDMEIERLKSQIDGLSKQNVDKLAEQVSDQVVEKTRVA